MFKSVLICCLFAVVFARPQAQKAPVAIISLESEVNHDGSFHYSYEGADGSKANQNGQLRSLGPDQSAETVQGSFSYVGDDGQNYQTSYVADENGYVASGAHLPVAPPVPEAIARALKFIAETNRKA